MTNDNSRTIGPLDRKALADRALELHGMNYNCAQAVACTLAPAIGADESVCFSATEAFGAGMGGLTETCGAISGAGVIVGMANSSGIQNPTSKQRTYRLMRKLVNDFLVRSGSTLCPELKGVGTGKPLRSCNECIIEGINLAADALESIQQQEQQATQTKDSAARA